MASLTAFQPSTPKRDATIQPPQMKGTTRPHATPTATLG